MQGDTPLLGSLSGTHFYTCLGWQRKKQNKISLSMIFMQSEKRSHICERSSKWDLAGCPKCGKRKKEKKER